MAPLTRFFRRMRRDETGSQLVEAALTFPLVLLVVLGILDFGLLFQQYEVLTNAAREGARIAVLPDYTADDAEARVQQYIDAAFLAETEDAVPTTTVGEPQVVSLGGTCMTTVTVTVTYPHEYVFLGGIATYFGGSFGTRDLVASSTMRSEVAGATCP